MKARSVTLAVFAAAVILSPIRDVEACGPFFEDDVFVNNTHPDDLASFSAGQLGILQAGYDSNEYAVAFRYLNGGRLSAAELQAYVPPSPPLVQPAQNWNKMTPAQVEAAQAALRQAQTDSQPAGKWLLERAEYTPSSTPVTQPPSFPTDFLGHIVFDPEYLNCPDDAFARATLTLKNRAATWGAQSSYLADWIHAQDAVFSNCVGKAAAFPAPAPSDSPALLKADRAYQVAAAALYAGKYDDAARQFSAIAADKSSPWAPWGQYLAARATVRNAFDSGKDNSPWSGELASYDAETMQRAQQMLESLLSQPNPTPSRSIIQSELNFVLARTDPDRRAAEVSAALAGPAPDANFRQDLEDLSWVLEKRGEIKSPAPLLAWIAAWRGAGNAASAYSTWQQNHSLPWLVVAIAKAAPSDPFVPQLIDEAGKIAPDSPAYDTIFYNRVRLLTALKRNDEARALLDAALPALRKQKPSSKLNALLGERMAIARDLNEFLVYAPRFTLSTGSEGADDLQGQCIERAHPAHYAPVPCPEAEVLTRFDEDAAQILNQQTSLPLLVQAAGAASLPQNLRQDLAVMAWTRAVLLQDAKSAAALQPLLPKAIRDAVGSSVGFPADFTILHNPGIRPYLESGVSRVASFSYFDELRDNWWCRSWAGPYASVQAKAGLLPVEPIFTSDQVKQAASEVQQLRQMPDSILVIGQRVIDYAKAQPDDPHVPEALAFTVRATHYACQTYEPKAPPRPIGDTTSKYTPISKAAFELLHKRYPKSPWTLKTPYYY